MAATVAAVGSVQSTTGQTVGTSTPSGTVSGSLLVLFLTVRDATTTQNPSTPSGWASAGSTSAAANRVYAWTRYADGTATDTPTLDLGIDASQGMQSIMVRVAGGASSSPVDSTNSGNGTTQATLAIPTTSVASNGSLALCCMGVATGSSAVTNTWPGSWAENADSWIDSVVRHTLTLGSLGVDAGTSTGGSVTPSASSTFAALTVIIKPSAGGTPAGPLLHGKLTGGGILVGGRLVRA